MAIIRKGDKAAEAKLKERARKESSAKFARNMKSTNTLLSDKPTRSERYAKKTEDKKGISGARTVVYGKATDVRKAKPGSIGPVSGSDLAIKNARNEKFKKNVNGK